MEAKLEFKKKIKGTQKIVPLLVGTAEEVIEGKYNNGKFYPVVEDKTLSKEFSPKIGKIYLDVSTDKQYKWDGEEYKEVNDNNVYTKNETYNKQETNALVGAAENAIKVTYNELVTLRNNSQLVPGRFYRITDYENNSLVNFDGLTLHQFDIILLALTEDKLSEDAKAVMNEDNIYDVTFYDGITKKCYIYQIGMSGTIPIVHVVLVDTKLGLSDVYVGEDQDIIIDEINKTAIVTPIGGYEVTEAVNENTYNYFQDTNLAAWKLKYCLDNDSDRFNWVDNNSHGALYFLSDETGDICKLKWRELKTLRDSAALVAGAKYRIIDYVTTTVQENTRSAGHQFDIIVTALTEGKLSEEASAAMHENIYDVTFNDMTRKCYLYKVYDDESLYNVVDCETLLGWEELGISSERINEETKTVIVNDSANLTEPNLQYNYFQNSNLSAWKVLYSIDNDTDRFVWANAGSDYIEISVNGENKGKFYRSQADDTTLTIGAATYNLYAWKNSDLNSNNIYYTWETKNPTEDSVLRNVTGAQYSQDYVRIVKCNYIGRGVIYRLIDEWNNDVAYDFKNIQFQRLIDERGRYDAEAGSTSWCYTFNTIFIDYDNDRTGNCEDASLISHGYYSDEESCECADNIIPQYYSSFASDNDNGGIDGQRILNNNVFLNSYTLAYGELGACSPSKNTFGVHCFDNTFGEGFIRNKVGPYCCGNIIGIYFQDNEVGTQFRDNVIGPTCQFNIFGGCFIENTLVDAFTNNIVGPRARKNTFGSDNKYNIIGADLYQCTTDRFFEDNIIGNSCSRLTIGQAFQHNTLGNSVSNCVTGTTSGSNVTETKSYIRFITIESGVKYVNITTSATTGASNYLQNIIIGKGVVGTSSSRKTITHPTVNDAFQTTYLPTGSTTVNV